jgi:predicted transposase YdaD
MDKINQLCCVCMTEEQRRVHNRQVENRRIRCAVIDTAKETGKREIAIEIAQKLLAFSVSVEIIAKATELSLEEVLILQSGGDLSESED